MSQTPKPKAKRPRYKTNKKQGLSEGDVLQKEILLTDAVKRKWEAQRKSKSGKVVPYGWVVEEADKINKKGFVGGVNLIKNWEKKLKKKGEYKKWLAENGATPNAAEENAKKDDVREKPVVVLELGNPKKRERNNGGRPPGTDSKKAEKKKKIEEATTWAAQKMIDLKTKKYVGKVPHGTLKHVCEEAAEKFNIPVDDIVAKTVRTRYGRGNAQGRMKSPMDAVEPTLVEFCINAYKMRAPLDKKGFLDMAINFIKGTETEQKVKAWRKKCKHEDIKMDSDLLGNRYYAQFVARHPGIISSKGHKDDITPADRELVKKAIEKNLNNGDWMNANGTQML